MSPGAAAEVTPRSQHVSGGARGRPRRVLHEQARHGNDRSDIRPCVCPPPPPPTPRLAKTPEKPSASTGGRRQGRRKTQRATTTPRRASSAAATLIK